MEIKILKSTSRQKPDCDSVVPLQASLSIVKKISIMVHCRVLQIEGVCVVDYGYPIITQGNFMLTVILKLMHTLREMLLI